MHSDSEVYDSMHPDIQLSYVFSEAAAEGQNVNHNLVPYYCHAFQCCLYSDTMHADEKIHYRETGVLNLTI